MVTALSRAPAAVQSTHVKLIPFTGEVQGWNVIAAWIIFTGKTFAAK